MKQVQLLPAEDALIGVFVVSDSNGEPVAADSTPTVTVYSHAGIDITADLGGVTVLALTTGVYGAYVACDNVLTSNRMELTMWPVATAVVSGLTRVVPLDAVEFLPMRGAGSVQTDAGNTATTFKVAGSAYAQVLDTTDDVAKCLIRFASGSLAGQVRKVTGFVVATGMLTVDSAFTTTPSSGDAFFLIDY